MTDDKALADLAAAIVDLRANTGPTTLAKMNIVFSESYQVLPPPRSVVLPYNQCNHQHPEAMSLPACTGSAHSDYHISCSNNQQVRLVPHGPL